MTTEPLSAESIDALRAAHPRAEVKLAEWFATLNEDEHGLVRTTLGELRAIFDLTYALDAGVRVAPSPDAPGPEYAAVFRDDGSVEVWHRDSYHLHDDLAAQSEETPRPSTAQLDWRDTGGQR